MANCQIQFKTQGEQDSSPGQAARLHHSKDVLGTPRCSCTCFIQLTLLGVYSEVGIDSGQENRMEQKVGGKRKYARMLTVVPRSAAEGHDVNKRGDI